MGVLALEAIKMRCGVEPFQLQASGFDLTTAGGAEVFSLSKYLMKFYCFVNILGVWTCRILQKEISLPKKNLKITSGLLCHTQRATLKVLLLCEASALRQQQHHSAPLEQK